MQRLLALAAGSVMLLDRTVHPVAMAGGTMVLYSGTAGGERALERAIAQAWADAEPLSVLLLPGAADRSRVRAVRAKLREAGVHARLIQLRRAGAHSLVRAIRQERPGMLFLAGDSSLLSDPAISWWVLLQQLPLVLVP